MKKAFKSILDFYYGTAKYWDTLFISPPYANEFAVMACTLSLQYLLAGDYLQSPVYLHLRNYFVPIGWGLMFVFFAISCRRFLPNIIHRLGWVVFGIYWILYAVVGLMGNPGSWAVWAYVPLAVMCLHNSSHEYRRSLVVFGDELSALVEKVKEDLG